MEPSVNGMLFVASDVNAEHEAELNNWYDREHVEERARIEGFISAARYQSVDGGKRYLGLYRTESLGAFTSAAYKAAFGKQTQWSVKNLNRMVSPMRRVAAVHAVVGHGSGSYLAVLTLDTSSQNDVLIKEMDVLGKELWQQAGFIQSYVLLPDTTLSSPLPTEEPTGRVMQPLVILETSSQEALNRVIKTASAKFAARITASASYALLWKLYAAELGKISS